MRTLKYNENAMALNSLGRTSQVIVNAIRAGHTIGGTIWRLYSSDIVENNNSNRSGVDGDALNAADKLDIGGGDKNVADPTATLGSNDQIIYMPLVNHRRDRHLNGSDIFQQASGKISVLICGIGKAYFNGKVLSVDAVTPSRAQRDE